MSLYFIGARICVRVFEYDWHMAIVDCIEYIVHVRNNVVLRCDQIGQLCLFRVLIPDLCKISGIEMGEICSVVVGPSSNSL